jgi:hypothetical protein
MTCTAQNPARKKIGSYIEQHARLGRNRFEASLSSHPLSVAAVLCWYGTEGTAIPLSKHDRHFLHFLATNDFFMTQDRVKAAIRQSHPSSPLSSLLVSMHYVATPPNIHVSLLSLQIWQDEDEKVEMEDFRHRTEAAEGRCILVQVCVRDGYSVNDGPVLRTFPLLVPLPENWLDE